MMALIVVLVVLLLGLTSLSLRLYLHLRAVADHARRRDAQLRDLCRVQEEWIRRGELACHDCPDLGVCVVSRGGCQGEARVVAALNAPPIAAEIYVPSTWRFRQE